MSVDKQSVSLFDVYRSMIIPPFCPKPCPEEAQCGTCQLYNQINYGLLRLDLKFIDNAIRPTLMVGRYLFHTPIFMTVRELLLIYCSRFVFMYQTMEKCPEFTQKQLINETIEKMMSIVQDPILPLEDVVGAMEETILYCEAVLKGFNQDEYDETVHALKTLKIIAAPHIVATTGLEVELLAEIENVLQKNESGTSHESVKKHKLQI